MARKKSSKRKESEVESVIIDESIYLEVEETAKEVEKTVAIEKAVISDTDLAKKLDGHPIVFEEKYQEALKRLVSKGIAADFGEDGHARGHKWRRAVK